MPVPRTDRLPLNNISNIRVSCQVILYMNERKIYISSVGFLLGYCHLYSIYLQYLQSYFMFYKIIVVWMRVRDVCSRIHLGGSGCSWYSIGACKTPWGQFQGEMVPNTVCPSLDLFVSFAVTSCTSAGWCWGNIEVAETWYQSLFIDGWVDYRVSKWKLYGSTCSSKFEM